MSFDVQEQVQGLVDQMGGSYLFISNQTPIKRIFGDPCPGYLILILILVLILILSGYPKDLRIEYEIEGRAGCEVFNEMRGFLRRYIVINITIIINIIIVINIISIINIIIIIKAMLYRIITYYCSSYIC